MGIQPLVYHRTIGIFLLHQHVTFTVVVVYQSELPASFVIATINYHQRIVGVYHEYSS